VVALFIPGFAGNDHASKALSAARDLFAEMGNDGDDPWIPLGAGVHTGVAYVGTVGEGDALDFTALGDPANTTARLASEAAAGEILVSAAAAEAAGLATEDRTSDAHAARAERVRTGVGGAGRGRRPGPGLDRLRRNQLAVGRRSGNRGSPSSGIGSQETA
jgi:class 3 adenylate cyclase